MGGAYIDVEREGLGGVGHVCITENMHSQVFLYIGGGGVTCPTEMEGEGSRDYDCHSHMPNNS